MASAGDDDEHPLMHGMRSAVRSDATAFSYSILITATFGAVQMEVGGVSAGRIFLFVVGATLAFTVIEAASSRFFRKRIREERGDVVVLGTAMAPLSVATALGVGVGTLQLLGGAPAWFVTPALATAAYVSMAALQLSFARLYEERHPPDS